MSATFGTASNFARRENAGSWAQLLPVLTTSVGCIFAIPVFSFAQPSACVEDCCTEDTPQLVLDFDFDRGYDRILNLAIQVNIHSRARQRHYERIPDMLAVVP